MKINGAVVFAGQYGAWALIGAEQTAGGYDVAWKNASTGQYAVWATDSNGNYISHLIGFVPGTSNALESLEPTFHQDLNGDGVVGIPPIESFGSTSLVQLGNNYFLDSISTGTGPELTINGTEIVAGQFPGWAPIGAERRPE